MAASGDRRLGVFGASGASEVSEVATEVVPEEVGGPGELCIFFRLSSNGFGEALGVGSAATGATVSAGGMVKVKAVCGAGIFSGAGPEAGSGCSSKTLLNHCIEAFFSKSKSSAVTV